MPPRRTLRVIDAAEDFAVDVHRSFSGPGRSKFFADQARRAAASVYSNLVEGFGRGPGADRMRVYRTARSECEEALGWIRLSYRIDQLASHDFHRLTNRGVAIIWMIRGLRY
jgi:four helix bundle protein